MMLSSNKSRAKLPVNGIDLEEVESYVRLGHGVNMSHNFQLQIVRRRADGLCKFHSISFVLKVSYPRNHVRLLNSTMLTAVDAKLAIDGGRRERVTEMCIVNMVATGADLRGAGDVLISILY